MTSKIIMYWDREDIFGNSLANIEVLSNLWIDVPPNACGFRLGRHNEPWHGAWYFAAPTVYGEPFGHGGIEYSSAFTGASPGPIAAIGPVHGCTSGAFSFQTPLAQYGVADDEPWVRGAGSFVADFDEAQDIEWLDFAGTIIPPQDIGPDPEPPQLPPEFFESPPEVKGCFRDFQGTRHCPAAATARAVAPTRRLPAEVAAVVARNSGFLPGVRVITPPTAAATRTVRSGKIEVDCPAELVLDATFFKDYTFAPATVRYRFRFAHGPVSTVFSRLVSEAGANTFTHAVPIPLPAPVGAPPSGGGVALGATSMAVVVQPEEPSSPGGGVALDTTDFTIEPLPDNEHKGSVRVEVINAFEGVVASAWQTYHVVCRQGFAPEPDLFRTR